VTKRLLNWVLVVQPLFSKVAVLQTTVVIRDWRYDDFFSLFVVLGFVVVFNKPKVLIFFAFEVDDCSLLGLLWM